MYNASDRKDIRRAEKEAKERESSRIRFLESALNTIEGRAWFHDLLSQCHIFADPFTGDALLEAYNKGERNIGLRIYAEIVARCPQQFLRMMVEANARDTTDAERGPTSEYTGSQGDGWDTEGSIGDPTSSDRDQA